MHSRFPVDKPANIRTCYEDRLRIRGSILLELRIDLRNRACYLAKSRIRAFCEEKPQTFASARKKKCECVRTTGKIADVARTKNLQNFDAGTREKNRSGCKVIDPCL